MKIYSIAFEADAYQSLIPEDLAVWKTGVLQFDGRKKSHDWPVPAFRIQNPQLEMGDFVGIGPGALGIRDPAVRPLLGHLERSGELLDVAPVGLGVRCLNVTECFNCLDHEKVSWVYGRDSGKPIRISAYAFKPELVPETPLFKIPETARARILTHQGITDEGEDFKSLVETLGLRGLRFELLWTND